MIKLIWAMDRNNLVGKGNLLPWHYREDLLYFKECTKNKTVIMGDNTYDSLMGYYKNKPLPFGKIYVATIKKMIIPNVEMVNNLDQFLIDFPTNEELFVIGGKTIYQLSLPYADQLLVTMIDDDHNGDVYFPKVDFFKYNLVSSRVSGKLDFRVYERFVK